MDELIKEWSFDKLAKNAGADGSDEKLTL